MASTPSSAKTIATRPFPTGHEGLTPQQVSRFSQWLDGRLAELERQFAQFQTNRSLAQSLRGSR